MRHKPEDLDCNLHRVKTPNLVLFVSVLYTLTLHHRSATVIGFLATCFSSFYYFCSCLLTNFSSRNASTVLPTELKLFLYFFIASLVLRCNPTSVSIQVPVSVHIFQWSVGLGDFNFETGVIAGLFC